MILSVLKQTKSATILLTIALIFLASQTACSPHKFEFKNIAKSDIDLVADTHLRQTNKLLRSLMVKLYKRNPNELKKNPVQSIKTRTAQIFNTADPLIFAELRNLKNIDAMQLCFDENFNGDRVFALITGMTGMIRKAYNDKAEFFMFDSLDHQKLYNCARNLEILAWRLSNKRDANNNLFLLSNSMEDEENNLSFERIFGKMIAIQDMMASITADRSNRTINHMVRSLATATFIPIP